jgi:predicted transcriptional regulator
MGPRGKAPTIIERVMQVMLDRPNRKLTAVEVAGLLSTCKKDAVYTRLRQLYDEGFLVREVDSSRFGNPFVYQLRKQPKQEDRPACNG